MSSGPANSGWQSPYDQTPPDPKAARTKTMLNVLAGLVALGAVMFAVGWNPPTNSVHAFSEASDYKGERESGCTNSGKGCHGAEASYSDFNVYHPDTECTTCHDYQGVGCIPCHMPPEKECQLCHDGTMEQAPDVVRLSDSYPKGHYRETTHTAMGTPMRDRVRGGVGGKASAACRDCHSRDLAKAHTDVPIVAGSTYGTSVGCGECHNDVRSQGMAEVLDDWKRRSCEGCHGVDSSAPQHALDVATAVGAKSPLSCGRTGVGCHDVNDLHAMHKDRPKSCAGSAEEGERSCHVIGSEAAKPRAVTCGGAGAGACHRLYENDTYSHDRDSQVHSPQGRLLLDTSYGGTACGDCHRMADDGTSLIEEHDQPTSANSGDPSNVCTNCHNHPASVATIREGWVERATSQACSTCHGTRGLPAAHHGDVAAQHEVSSAGCSDSGAGCHPTSDLMEVGAPTTTANIHRDCLRCHDWTESDGNGSYDPGKTTCGEGRDCHGAQGAYGKATSVHDGAAGLADGQDSAHHRASSRSGDTLWKDSASGLATACDACHGLTLGTEHRRVNSALRAGVGTICARCHNADKTAAQVVKGNWSTKGSAAACEQCHAAGSSRAIHASIETSHVATELAADSTPQPGACVSSGCHGSLDLRSLHRSAGCTAMGCHANSGNILSSGIKSCGGLDSRTGCHAGYSASMHFTDHAANVAGVVKGIEYTLCDNVGCFGCHVADLTVEHDNARRAGVIEGGGSTSCAICHEGVAGAGAFASLPAVKRAIANHDMRCSACHASGTNQDGPTFAASAHKEISTQTVLPPGTVWSDPAEEWKAAFDGDTGGGHNVMSFERVGASAHKSFPLTQFTIFDVGYIWALTPNSGLTAWLKPSVFEPGATETTESIQHIRMRCDDCHMLSPEMNGPTGSPVPIAIDPEYSQTEYANPTRDQSQFTATGTKRVVCFKCHQVYVGGVAGSNSPGGASLHGRHVSHPNLGVSSAHYNGEACIDCHVRSPHAWRRPRLLIRTVVATDGATPDAPPYVMQGHDGLLGIRLRSFDPQTQLRSGSCVTGGCHPSSSPNRHPRPSNVPTATYWP